MSSVLYDAPGPRAKVRNLLLTVVFLGLAVAAGLWVYRMGADAAENQWDKALWKPFTLGSTWNDYLLPGLGKTLKAAGLSLVIALPLGAILGIGRLSDHRLVRVPVGVVVEFLRAVPVLLMMVIANQLYANSGSVSSDDRAYYAVVTGLVLYNASVLAEIVRAGVLTLPKGQTEAAQAIGLRKGQTMRSILLPQAVTSMLPALVSQLVVIVKDTALGGAMLTYPELLGSSKTLASQYTNIVQALLVAAVIYIVVNWLLTALAHWLERFLRRNKHTGGRVLGAEAVEEINAASGLPSRGMPYKTGENTG